MIQSKCFRSCSLGTSSCDMYMWMNLRELETAFKAEIDSCCTSKKVTITREDQCIMKLASRPRVVPKP